MATVFKRIVQRLRFVSLHHDETDRQLLSAFAEHGDEAAFAELVRRHGPLVLGACRRILGNVQDSEDAFQATFLVLARKASSVAWHDCVKSWLHNVACRVALKLRAKTLRRREKEREASDLHVNPPTTAACDELRAVLDEELDRLPAKYSAPLLLCYLEGKTRDEAAEELGWSVGSVKGRLERGRELLRSRLAKRGLTLSAVLVTGLLGQASAGAAVPAALALATVQASLHFVTGASAHSAIAGSVLHLAQGVLHTMMMAKIKLTGMIVTLTLFAAAATWGVHQASVERAEGAQPIAFAQEKKDVPRDKKEVPREKKDGERNKQDILGLIKEIDMKIGAITVTYLRDGMNGDGAYSLADKNIKITSSFGHALALKDLEVGLRVHLELKGDNEVVAILVEHPQFFGALGHIDAKTRVVELRAERKISTAKVADDATITVFGKPAKLADVPLNERSHITMSFDRKTILAIRLGKAGGKEPERPAAPREGDRPVPGRVPGNVGTIIDIDAARGTLNLLSGRADDPTILALAVAKDLKVKVLFEEKAVQEIAFADVKKPLQAVVQLSDDKTTVTALSVRTPIVRGVLKAVDAAGNKVTLVNEGREETTLEVSANAVIRNQGRDGKLADLRPGDSVMLGLSLDRQRVIGIATQARGRDGER